jgi:hypothetical protein
VNLLYALETVELLLIAGVATEPGKDNNRQANQTAFAQVCLLQRRKLNYYLYCFFSPNLLIDVYYTGFGRKRFWTIYYCWGLKALGLLLLSAVW